MASVRRLSAIMFTDMVGSTASAHADEARALQLRDEQAALVRPLFGAHQGREVKSMGDGFLAEFDSALRALECAIDIQQRLHERNGKPGVVPILLRIGIHLGDVEQRQNDIFGDAVNIAARIEPLAAPGGVCISADVFSQVRNKISNRLEKLPTTELKGITGSVEIYQLVLPWGGPVLPASGRAWAGVAVLPFANISPDPGDAYLADGMTEELITVLAQIPELLVIARSSVAPYRSTTKGVGQIGAELGVDSVLEGSVRRSGNQLRITVQLIDVATQGHRWAMNYDRALENVFALQSEIADQVAQALRIRIGQGTSARLSVHRPVQPESYLAYLQGRTAMHHETEASFRLAKEQFQKAISLDPENAAAHAGLADAIRFLAWWGFERGRPRAEWDQISRASAAQALRLDPNLADAHCSLGLIHWDDFQWAAAEGEFRIALNSSPSHAGARAFLGFLLLDLNRPEEAMREFALAEAADPRTLSTVAEQVQVLIWLGRLDDAKVKLDRMKELDPVSDRYHWELLFYHWATGDLGAARQDADRIAELDPKKECWHVENVYATAAGRLEEARAWIRPPNAANCDPNDAQDAAIHYGLCGDLDECFRWLAIAVDRFAFAPRAWRLNPHFAAVRNDPRFQAILERTNLA